MIAKCCCVGHRDMPQDKADSVESKLREEIEQAIEDGYTTFTSGFAPGADQLFAAIVAQVKQEHEGIRLVADIPNRDELEKLQDTPELAGLLAACDSVGCMQAEGFKDIKGARFLVQESGRVLAVYDGRENGNTALAVRYAKELGRDLRVIDI